MHPAVRDNLARSMRDCRPRWVFRFWIGCWIAVCCLVSIAGAVSAQPIKLHPDNPHYFFFRGRPTILITAGEHYGAVLNLDIDYIRYLDVLKAHGFNLTRAFSGTYREV